MPIKNETQFGRTYFDILRSINDSVGSSISQIASEYNIEPSVIRKLISVAQSSVETTGGNGYKVLLKSS